MSVKVVVTPWVTHNGGAIYSLDVNTAPNTYKLATCGNGDAGDGLIMIWDLLPMLSEKHGRNVEKHTPLLARIPMTRGVNQVRWSRCGTYFAAASDDKSVTVWEYSGQLKSAGTIGKGEATREKYRCVHTLHGHSMEALAVEWSWDGRFLASSSMDNTVVVWNALKLPERVVVLDAARDGHTGSVKGLSFDPIGKYLASQSQDKTLRVWSTENWTCEATIAEPFNESAQSTMFMRPEWSPDGKMLVAPCAMNNGGPTAQLIIRGSWDTQRDLVGNRKAVTVVRCAPRCFEYVDYKGRVSKVSLYAIGSRDKSLSVWALPGLHRPLVVFFNFFKHSVMDASWKGTSLFCCSQDGSVKTLIFDEESVGRMLRQQEMSDLCFDLYRTRPPQYTPDAAENGGRENGVNGSPTKGAFIETAADLIASRMAVQPKDTHKEAREREREEAEKRAKAEAELVEKRKEQIEKRTKDGKRRIQPVFLCSTIDNSVQEKPEIPDDVMGIDKIETAGPSTSSVSVPKDRVRAPDAMETDGESSISSSSDSDEDSSEEEVDDFDRTEDDSDGPRVKRKKLTERDRLLLADFRRPVLRPLERLQKDSLTLAAAELRPSLQQPIIGMKQAILYAQNEWASSSGVRATKVHRVRWEDESTRPSFEEGPPSDDRLVWTAFLAAPVLVMSANSKWAVLSCADCSLYVLSTSTGAVQFMLQLDSLPAQLGVQDSRAYVLTSNGYFSSWELSEKCAILSRIPVLDIVSNDVHLNSISLAPTGAPLISFSNGSTFSYSPKLQSWVPVDPCSGLSRLSGESLANEDVCGGVISRTIRSKKRPGVDPSTTLATRNWVGQSQMESWIFAAVDAKSFEDLRPMVARYTDMLVINKSKDKLRELLTMLDSWMERARKREKCDEWMNEEKMKQMREMVRHSINSDARVGDVLKSLEEEGNMIF